MTTLAEDPLLIFHHPRLFLPVSFFVLWLSAWIGTAGFKGLRSQIAETREVFTVVESATLTLLALIIGFTFSMALGRYDMRKNYEEQEANAIGTEFLRADVLPATDAAKVRALLLSYLDQRVLFYTTRDKQELGKINAMTSKLQSELCPRSWHLLPLSRHPLSHSQLRA